MKPEFPKIDYSRDWQEKPFFSLTLKLLNAVRDNDLSSLAHLCDDDYGIVDINTEGGSQVIRNRKEWEKWFKSLFSELQSRNAITWSEITNYEAVISQEMGYSVVDFDQMFVVEGQQMKFSVLATIIWKKEEQGWKESRYHSSLIGGPVPVQ
mgnify:CR=1 FL=1